MIKSMTGFVDRQANLPGLGKVAIEMRSTNHKFLDIVCHLPEGFFYLEEKVKKEIEKKIKRGRITFLFNILSKPKEKVLLNKELLKQYYTSLNKLKTQLKIKEPLKLDTLLQLPGILNIEEPRNFKNRIWPRLRISIRLALIDLVRHRAKEGQALYLDLKQHNQELNHALGVIKSRFKKVVKEKVKQLPTSDEKSSFLKSSDINEEIIRIRFHINNFQKKLQKSGAVGKELDFIAQELSREANTIGAKSVDALVSGNVVAMKSQIEKMREQLQNVE